MVIRKKGISAIVATVLIVLITVAAVTIIWTVIIPLLRSNLDIDDITTRLDIDGENGYTAYDSETFLFSVQVSRPATSTAEFTKMNVHLFFEDGNTYPEIVDAPEINQKLTYTWNLIEYLSAPVKVSVAPIFVKGNSVKEGAATSSNDLLDKNIDPETTNVRNDSFGQGDCTAGETKPCGDYNAGACKYGVETCIENDDGAAFWPNDIESCEGFIDPATEVCDADEIDEDCDGSENEGCNCNEGQEKDCGKFGACWGIQTCDLVLNEWGECNNSLNPPNVPETCNGIDDDCDGVVDEDLTRQCGTTDVGACEYGVESCTGGTWPPGLVGCEGNIEPVGSESSCTDGSDDDCDGATDCADDDCSDDTSCPDYIFQENSNSISGSYSWTWNMGYRFVPESDEQVVELCKYSDGDKLVKLYDSSYNVIGSVTVSGADDSWSCAELATAVDITAGSTYYVAAHLDGSIGYYKGGVGLPKTYNGIEVQTSVYQKNVATLTSSHNTYAAHMYGMVDIGIAR